MEVREAWRMIAQHALTHNRFTAMTTVTFDVLLKHPTVAPKLVEDILEGGIGGAGTGGNTTSANLLRRMGLCSAGLGGAGGLGAGGLGAGGLDPEGNNTTTRRRRFQADQNPSQHAQEQNIP